MDGSGVNSQSRLVRLIHYQRGCRPERRVLPSHFATRRAALHRSPWGSCLRTAYQVLCGIAMMHYVQGRNTEDIDLIKGL